jgi:hypothetical protein
MLRAFSHAKLRRQDFLAEAERERRIAAALALPYTGRSSARTPEIVLGLSVSPAALWARIVSLQRQPTTRPHVTEPC